jgi:hypothetical protein
MPLEIGGIYHFTADEDGIPDDGYPSYGGEGMFAGLILFQNRTHSPDRPGNLVAVAPVQMWFPYDTEVREELLLWRDFEFATGYTMNNGLMSRYTQFEYPTVLRDFFLGRSVPMANIEHDSPETLFRDVGISTWWVDQAVQADAQYFGRGVTAIDHTRSTSSSPSRIRKIPKSNSMFKVNKKGF